MFSKTIVGDHTEPPRNLDASPARGAGSRPASPLDSQQLNRIAVGIVSDATHSPQASVERFDTQQQGE